MLWALGNRLKKKTCIKKRCLEEFMTSSFIAKFREKFNSDAHLNELIKGAGEALVLRIGGIIAGYVFTLLVTRTLGARVWGIFALSLVVLQIASVIGRLGMDTALLRFTAEYTAKKEIYALKEIYKKALTLVVPFSILVAISVYSLSPLLANKFFHKPYLTDYFRITSFMVVPSVILWIHSESIRGLKKIKEYMLLQQSGIFLIAVILFLIGTTFVRTYFLPFISYALAILILAFISMYLWVKHIQGLISINQQCSYSTNSSFNSSINRLINYSMILNVSFPMLFSSSLALTMSWTDTILLGMFRSTQEVGIYNVALKVSMMTSVTLVAINAIAAPKFAEFWGKGDIKGLTKVAQQSTKLIFWTSFPVLLLFLIFPKPILGIFGEEFKQGAVILMILTVGQFVNAISGSVGNILNMTNQQIYYRNIVMLSTLINVLLNFILVPILGILGSALAASFTMIFWNIGFGFKVKKMLGSWIIFIPKLNKIGD